MNKFQTLVIFTILIIFSFNASAQDLTKVGNQWNVYYPPTFEPSYTTSLIKTLRDTIIDGERYSIIGYGFIDDELPNLSTNQYIRQDSTKKVFLKIGDNDETVLYDFGLELGDTIAYEIYQEYCKLEVTAIDSVQLNNGEMRKRLQLEGVDTPYYYPTYWIEGIGSNLDVIQHFMSFCFFDFPTELLCFYENGELLYPENPPTCILTDVEDLNLTNVNIYPNPFRDNVFIEDPAQTFTEVKIYNALGQLLKEEKLNAEFTEISLGALMEGIYYLNFVDEKGNTFTQKIVHQ